MKQHISELLRISLKAISRLLFRKVINARPVAICWSAPMLQTQGKRKLKQVRRCTLSCVALSTLAGVVNGQVAAGTPTFSAFDRHEVDTVDLMSNNIVIGIPIMSKSGAFPVKFGMSGNYYVFPTNGVWQTASAELNTQLIGAANNFISSNGLTSNTPVTGVACPHGGTTTKYFNWSVIEANGTQHFLPFSAYSDQTSGGTSCLVGSGFTTQTTDGSGLTVSVPANGTFATSIFARNGMLLGTNLIMDSNSNKLIL